MARDVFETEAWFANLLAHGFERPPHKNWEWRLPALQHGHAAHLHLMQQSPGEPLAALSNYYSCLYGPVGSVEAIRRSRPRSGRRRFRRCDSLRVLPCFVCSRWMPSAWLAGLQNGLRAASYWSDRFFCFGNWYQPVPERRVWRVLAAASVGPSAQCGAWAAPTGPRWGLAHRDPHGRRSRPGCRIGRIPDGLRPKLEAA